MDPLLENGDLDGAAQAVNELADTARTSDDGLYVAMARLSLNSDLYDSVEESLASAEEAAGPADRYRAYRHEIRARMAQEQGDWPSAIEWYQQASAAAPDRADYLLRIAELLALNQDWAEAAAWLERFIATEPVPESIYWELLGEYRIGAGVELDAVRAFETAIEIEPYSYIARARLAEVFETRGELDRAIEFLEYLTVYAVDRDPGIYTRLARIHSGQGRWEEALEVLRKGARIFPANPDIYKALREARFQVGA
jgi:tetratricopeptide (TPR) repeat protein